ncbi:MAG: xanthine phosphoribosyltransferase [Clostridia bacterium]|nr:xanthine phosphoribosyltransferase [Clostridia bacterium]
MQLLEDRILKDGKILSGNVLKVDSFINHQMDVAFISELCKEFYRLYKESNVTKIITIEASGIGIACLAAQQFNVPMVFAKKSKTSNISNDFYCCEVESYTHNTTNKVIISKEFINPDDRVLLIDDFLANGKALLGLKTLVEMAGATVVGAGIVIEKGFQPGGELLRKNGLRVESLAIIKSMSVEDGISFI